MRHIAKLVPDTSVVIEGFITKKINKDFTVDTILLHEALLCELEHQANQNREIGFLGLDELENIKRIAEKSDMCIEFTGRKPSASEIRHANLGEIDGLMRELAYECGGTFITSDHVQARVARAKGIEVIEVEMTSVAKKVRLASFFDEDTMSVHLRENTYPFAKKGAPGKWRFVRLSNQKISSREIQEISRELMEQIPARDDAFIEIERSGSSIIQFGRYRIVITKPPFSDGWEVTAVRPVKLLELQDYRLSEKLGRRVKEQAEGILIAGAPGQGKTTFARALAKYYAAQDKIVKTVEAPRDLILPENITQFAISHGTPEEIHDILLLSRPDYTFFDEMRNTKDFQLYADLRLSGVGMVGIIHATNPIDAIQRFIGRIDLGVIPQIIDTVVFIKNGCIDKLYEVSMSIKVPSGMREADLARPIVTVRDFESEKLEYEIYSYGEETVVVPITKAGLDTGIQEDTPSERLAAEMIKEKMKKFTSQAEVRMLSPERCEIYVPKNEIGALIGKQGKRIEKIEKSLGIKIDIQELAVEEKSIMFSMETKKKFIYLYPEERKIGKEVDIYVEGKLLMSAKISKKNQIRITKNSKQGTALWNALLRGKNVVLKT